MKLYIGHSWGPSPPNQEGDFESVRPPLFDSVRGRVDFPGGAANRSRLLEVGQVVHLHPCEEIVPGRTCDACGGEAWFRVVGIDRGNGWAVIEPDTRSEAGQ